MSDYQITIQMSDPTVDGLNTDAFQLYALKVVQGPGGGVPVVWFSTGTFAQTTHVKWTENYQAFTSQQVQLAPDVQLTASANYPIGLGEMLNVTNPEGTGVVAEGPDPQAIAICNQTVQPMTCGISQQQGDGSYQPLCAFPLPGSMEDLILPVEQVFLMFSTQPVSTGTIIEQAYSQGVLVDLTVQSQQTVQFDLNQGWTPEPWARVYQPNTVLAPLLITAGGEAGLDRAAALHG